MPQCLDFKLWGGDLRVRFGPPRALGVLRDRKKEPMPGLWVHLADNPDFFKGFEVEKGTYIESLLYDEKFDEQGKGLWRILDTEERKKTGLWVLAKLVAVSDEHLKWWLDDGPGAVAQRRFSLHFCVVGANACTSTKRRRSLEFHTDYFRFLTTDEVTDMKVSWMKDAVAKPDIEGEVAKLAGSSGSGVKKAKGKAKASPASGNLDWDDDGDLDLPELEGDDAKKGGNVRERLTALRKEVGEPLADAEKAEGKKEAAKEKGEKKRKKKSRSRSRKKSKKRALASDSSPDKYVRPKWFGRTTVVSSSSSSYDDDDGAEAQTGKKEKDAKEKSSSKSSKKGNKKKKKKKRKLADRGPFSAGPVQRYDGKAEGEPSETEDEAEEGQVFRAGVSQKSRQLQLIEYAEKYPGRLTARLLGKMRQVLAREETPLNQQQGQNLTPPVASAYFLTVILNQYKDRINLRTSRELRSLAKSLDLIVQNAPERAADVLAQRIKSIEVSLADQSWGRAQHVELIPAEGAVLLDKDELAMATKEQNDDYKMRNNQGFIGWRQDQPRGNPQDKGKSKGKGKNKKGKNSGANWGAPAEAEKTPPA